MVVIHWVLVRVADKGLRAPFSQENQPPWPKTADPRTIDGVFIENNGKNDYYPPLKK
jgi:hypothetical protein